MRRRGAAAEELRRPNCAPSRRRSQNGMATTRHAWRRSQHSQRLRKTDGDVCKALSDVRKGLATFAGRSATHRRSRRRARLGSLRSEASVQRRLARSQDLRAIAVAGACVDSRPGPTRQCRPLRRSEGKPRRPWSTRPCTTAHGVGGGPIHLRSCASLPHDPTSLSSTPHRHCDGTSSQRSSSPTAKQPISQAAR